MWKVHFRYFTSKWDFQNSLYHCFQTIIHCHTWIKLFVVLSKRVDDSLRPLCFPPLSTLYKAQGDSRMKSPKLSSSLVCRSPTPRSLSNSGGKEVSRQWLLRATVLQRRLRKMPATWVSAASPAASSYTFKICLNINYCHGIFARDFLLLGRQKMFLKFWMNSELWMRCKETKSMTQNTQTEQHACQCCWLPENNTDTWDGFIAEYNTSQMHEVSHHL